MRKLASFTALVIALGVLAADAGVPLLVHEWGTITTVHAADGTPQGKLNRIEPAEVLPEFVHRYEPSSTRNNPDLIVGKRPFIPGRQDVTMRLETPVIYFYPQGALNQPFDVSVVFRGGVLNEFYPDAGPTVGLDHQRIQEKRAAGMPMPWDGKLLSNYVVSSLTWKGLKLSSDIRPPATQSKVWLAPRDVRATGVTTPAGESERYVFYRGVAALQALMRTRLTAAELKLSAPGNLIWLTGKSADIPRVWFAHIRPDGTAAYQEHGALTLDPARAGAALISLKRFAASDFDEANLFRLRASMKRELVAQGLFEDEAQAMLNTWQASYFEKPGARLFYVVPAEWTNYFLPLKISTPAEITRVIIGRVDLME
jgi:hypothetical protein